MATVKDFFGQLLVPGDRIAYAAQFGDTPILRTATVIRVIGENRLRVQSDHASREATLGGYRLLEKKVIKITGLEK